MKKILEDKKKLLVIVGIVLVVGICSVLLISNRNKLSNKNNKVAVNDQPVVEKIEVDSTINEISVISARIEKLNDVSSIYVKIKNNTNSVIDKSDLKLISKDSSDNVLLTSFIKDFNDFKVGEEREFQVSTKNDITNASKYIVEKA